MINKVVKKYYNAKNPAEKVDRIFCFGAGSGGRTRTVSPPPDFESGTSANSIIPAHLARRFFRT